MKQEEYFDELIENGLDLELYQVYLGKRIGKSIDKQRVKEELLDAHANLKLSLEEADYHIRLLTTPVTNINSTEVYTMDEAMSILQISRSQLRSMCTGGIIEFRKDNERVFRPFKWSIDAIAHGLTQYLSNDYTGGKFYITIDENQVLVDELYVCKEEVVNEIKKTFFRSKKIRNLQKFLSL